jgi:hypothetical protein
MIKNNFNNQFQKNLANEDYIGSKIDNKILDKLGFFVLKKAFKKKVMDQYRFKFLNDLKKKNITKTKNHLVEVKIDKLGFFQKIYKDPSLKKAVKNFYNGNVGSDFYRIVKKDNNNTNAVFCHQDSGYQFGSFNRYSFFISLTKNNNLNGGLIVYPSTHQFGYLGDVGEISNKITKNFIKICPNLEIGDVLIMHSSLWHESDENFEKKDRIYLEVHIQDANDPSTKFMITGQRKKTTGIPFDINKIFSNSRTQRIISLKNKLKKIETKLGNRI